MDMIKLDDLKAYRDNRIASGDSDFDEMDRLSAFIATVETIEPKRGKPDFADCEKCSRTYGTFGCCSTVSNEWVYSCLEGMLEKAYADGIKSVETMIRYDELIKMERPTATDIVKAIREAECRGYMKAVEDRPQGE